MLRQSNDDLIDEIPKRIEPTRKNNDSLKLNPLKDLAHNVWSKLRYHLTSSTGMITAGVPFFSSLESGMVGMSYLDSLSTRFTSIVVVYSGLGLIYTGGRSKLKRFLSINEDSSKGLQNAADLAYGAIFNGAVQPFFYAAENLLQRQNIDPNILFHQMELGLSLGSLGGIFVGWGVDIYNDFYGSRESKRLPKKIRSLPKPLKVSMATFLTAGSLFFSMNYLPKIIPNGGDYGKEPSIPYSIVEKIEKIDLSLQADMERAKSSLELKLNLNKR